MCHGLVIGDTAQSSRHPGAGPKGRARALSRVDASLLPFQRFQCKGQRIRPNRLTESRSLKFALTTALRTPCWLTPAPRPAGDSEASGISGAPLLLSLSLFRPSAAALHCNSAPLDQHRGEVARAGKLGGPLGVALPPGRAPPELLSASFVSPGRLGFLSMSRQKIKTLKISVRSDCVLESRFIFRVSLEQVMETCTALLGVTKLLGIRLSRFLPRVPVQRR